MPVSVYRDIGRNDVRRDDTGCPFPLTASPATEMLSTDCWRLESQCNFTDIDAIESSYFAVSSIATVNVAVLPNLLTVMWNIMAFTLAVEQDTLVPSGEKECR